MRNDNKTKVIFEWLKGFSVETEQNKFFTDCLGKAVLFFFRGFVIYLLIKAIAPNGLVH